jgi:hypothetical protein
VGARRSRCACARALALGLAAACAGSQSLYATGDGSVTPDGLRRLRWSEHGAEYLRPGAEFGAYRQVLLDRLAISDPEPEGPRLYPEPRYRPTPEYLEAMRRTYRESLAGAFGKGRPGVATLPGPGVLSISGQVVDLELTARLDPEREPDRNEMIANFGELTLIFDVRDSQSGESLLRTVDRDAIARNRMGGMSRNSTGANVNALREVFRRQTLRLRQRLVELQRMGRIPAPPET